MSKTPQTFDPVRHCGAWNKAHTKRCCMPSGAKTIHSGTGKCWLHGGMKAGDKRLKHGKTSAIFKSGLYDNMSGPMGDAIKRVRESGYDIMDARPEAEACRAVINDVAHRHADIQSALDIIAKSNDPVVIAGAVGQIKEAMKNRPPQQMNPEVLTSLMERFTRILQAIHKIQSTATITLDQFVDAVHTYEKFVGMILLKHLKDDSETLKAIVDDIQGIDIPQADIWARFSAKG
jgi:hypothetical protein